MINKLRCFLFGHPPYQGLNDGLICFRPSSALGVFTLTYCCRCKELYFKEVPNYNSKDGHKDDPRYLR